MLLPFALAFAVQAQRQQRKPLAVAWYALGIALLLATALSYSRAGIALAVLGVVLAAMVLRPSSAGDQRHLMPLSALGVAALAVAAYAWDGIATRLAQDPLGDLRWQYLRYGFDTLVAYLPWGSGFGSFRWAYAPLEPVVAMTSVFADRAHDDVLQLGIEAGIPGLLLLLALLAILGTAAARKFRMGSRLPDAHDAFGKVACIALLIPMLHSLVDYPLRTLAIACVFGLALSVLLAAQPVVRSRALPKA
jgi:O-antigen ligase